MVHIKLSFAARKRDSFSKADPEEQKGAKQRPAMHHDGPVAGKSQIFMA
jgi:hypothetical protein